MKQWDSLVDGYMAVNEAQGLSGESLRGIRDELDRCGCWLKRRRPKPPLEEVDGPVLIAYLRHRSHFRAKSTLSSIASKVRCFGEYLVERGEWKQNPMRWVRGPKLDPRGKATDKHPVSKLIKHQRGQTLTMPDLSSFPDRCSCSET